MKIRVQIDRAEAVWKVALSSPDDATWQPAERFLESSLHAEFPLPPAKEIAAWRPDLKTLLVPPGSEAGKLRALAQSCLGGDPAKGDAALLGGFLHAVLFGPHWPAIEAFAGGLEIALALEDHALAALPWEMMHAPFDPGAKLIPLAAHPLRHVAVLRFVPGLERQAQPLELPLRVLFAVGSQLDSALRPGAEYLGLLRRLGIATTAPAGNARINLRLLTETTTDELEDAIRSFQPHVVHFICHGAIDPNSGAHLLLTEREDGARTGLKGKGVAAVNAALLLPLLAPARAAGEPQPLPGIVVLNACHTAEPATGAAVGLSLAAQLLAGGVPVVIGMSGEVADGACRLFTRGFYEALIEGKNLPLAAAAARRSAMLHYANFDQNIDWARLTFFAKDWAATQATPAVQTGVANPAALIAAAAARHLPAHGRLLCDRMEGIRAYETFRNGLATGRRQSVLTFGVTTKAEEPEDKFSKTMLLETIAVQAVLDGFVPCRLSIQGSADKPANILEFALLLATECDEARRRFGLETKLRSAFAPGGAFAVAVAACAWPLPAADINATSFEIWVAKLRAKVRELPPGDDLLGGSIMRSAIRADFDRLRADAEAALGGTRLPLLMIDNLHDYAGVADPLLHELVGKEGFLGGKQGAPLPLVFSYSQFDRSGHENEVTRTIVKFLSEKNDLVASVELRPIDSAEEQRLAYSQYLLARTPPLAMNTARNMRGFADAFFQEACATIKGVPSRFETSAKLNGNLSLVLRMNILVEANDEKILSNSP